MQDLCQDFMHLRLSALILDIFKALCKGELRLKNSDLN